MALRPRVPRLAASKMGRGAEAAWEAALSVVLGAVLGILLDRWLDTSPIFLLILLPIGSIAAFRRLIAMNRQALKDYEQKPK